MDATEDMHTIGRLYISGLLMLLIARLHGHRLHGLAPDTGSHH